MLPWLRKRLTKKQLLLFRLWAIAFLFHCFLIILFFFSNSMNHLNKKIVLHALPSKKTKVIYLPFYSLPPAKSYQPNSTPLPQAASVPQKKIERSNTNTEKPTTAIKSAPRNTEPKKPIVQKQPQAKKTTSAQQLQSKTVPATKKEAPKPTPQPKVPLQTQQKSATPAVPVKTQTPAVNSTEKKAQSLAPTVKDLNKREVIDAELPASIQVGQDVIYVSQEERTHFEIQQHMQRELETCWQAPKIMTNNLACELEVEINKSGKAAKVMIIKGSGAKLYDILAQKAFRTVSYPQPLWSRTITFTFKGQ